VRSRGAPVSYSTASPTKRRPPFRFENLLTKWWGVLVGLFRRAKPPNNTDIYQRIMFRTRGSGAGVGVRPCFIHDLP